MEPKSVIRAWISDLQEVLEKPPLAVGDLRIGVFYTAVDRRLLEIVSQDGSGYFFGDCAEKISIVRVGHGTGREDRPTPVPPR